MQPPPQPTSRIESGIYGAIQSHPRTGLIKAMIERGFHRNAVVVALANTLARVAWAALRKEATFEHTYPVAG